MRLTLFLPLALIVAGCSGPSRAEIESYTPNKITEETLPNGDTIAVYDATRAEIDPTSHVYTFQRGVSVVTYRDGIAIDRYFVPNQRLKP